MISFTRVGRVPFSAFTSSKWVPFSAFTSGERVPFSAFTSGESVPFRQLFKNIVISQLCRRVTFQTPSRQCSGIPSPVSYIELIGPFDDGEVGVGRCRPGIEADAVERLHPKILRLRSAYIVCKKDILNESLVLDCPIQYLHLCILYACRQNTLKNAILF